MIVGQQKIKWNEKNKGVIKKWKNYLVYYQYFLFLFTNTMNLISCGNIANKKPHLSKTKQKEPIIKNIFYYEKLKQEITA